MPASAAPASAHATMPTTVPAIAINSATAEVAQEEFQFSNHPGPNVATTVGGANPLTAANLLTTSNP
ncbi:hypothetical protein BGW41_006501 [Actinomortierella wolfii]|nr:hypothetical protein BGW41_006501 [Actinomortierella wolfii]